jgi:hypothetical protein
MPQMREDKVVFLSHHPSREWATLIRRLRGIGLDDAARRLELAASTFPADRRDNVPAEQSRTDCLR